MVYFLSQSYENDTSELSCKIKSSCHVGDVFSENYVSSLKGMHCFYVYIFQVFIVPVVIRLFTNYSVFCLFFEVLP